MKNLIFTLITLVCAINANAQKPDNTKPMYGEVAKDEGYKKADETFILNAIQECGTRDSAVQVYLKLAWRHFYYKDLLTAMKRFNQVWLLNPNYADAYYGFAALLEVSGNHKEAQRFYVIAKIKDTANTRVMICMQRIANCKENIGDIDGAIDTYEKIIAIDSNFAFAYKKLGYFYIERPSSKAIMYLNKAIMLDSTDANTFYNRGYYYQIEGNYQKAIEDYTACLKLDSLYEAAYVNRALNKMQLNELLLAKQDWEAAVMLNPNYGKLRLYLGNVKLKLNDKEGACNDFSLAKSLGEKAAKQLIKENCR